MNPRAQEPEEGEFELLLARCLEAHARDGAGAVAPLLAEHAHEAPRLRARLAELERLGLLESPTEVRCPARIGPHRVLGRIGQGGMGEVLLAEDAASGERIAIKLARLGPDFEEQGPAAERLRTRFAREVRALSSLDHPGIVAIRDAGEHEGRPWYAMEFVRGATLAQLIERLRASGRAPGELGPDDVELAWRSELDGEGVLVANDARTYVEWVARVLSEIARALDHAHRCGVVHRDVKPSNVLLGVGGRALVLDLGLAHLRDDPALTRSGDLAGTPFYAAPEQVEPRGRALDGRTDVWGLGVTLYELLSLRRPFPPEGGEVGAAQVLRSILERDPWPPRRHHAELSRELESICLKALEKDPRRRYPSAAELAFDLERFLAFRPVHARPIGPARRLAARLRRSPALAVAWGLALLVVVGLPAGLLVANAAVRDQARRAERSALEAGAQAAARARVVDHLVALFRPADGADPAAVLDEQVERLQWDHAEGTLARASLLEASARILANLGQPARALPLYDRALALRQGELGSPEPELARLLVDLAQVHLDLGDSEPARALGERALIALGDSDGGPSIAAAGAQRVLARAARSSGDPQRALAHFAAAQEHAAGLGAEREELLAGVLAERARLEAQLGLRAEARAGFERAIALRRSDWLPDARALAPLYEELAPLLGEFEGEQAAEHARSIAAALRRAQASDALPPPPPLALRPAWRPLFDTQFQEGITALQARRTAAAVAAFEACLELRPEWSVCAYNLACAHALGGDVENGLEWLARAARWGWGRRAGALATTRNDPDLEALWGERRFAELLAQLERSDGEARNFVALPARRAPQGAAPPQRLLVVLHDAGRTKLDVVQGPWAAAAQASGRVLLAPSAERWLGETPQHGLAWYDDLSAFVRRPWSAVEAPAAVVRAELERADIDASEPWLAGEGAGAQVAFDLALRSPGLWERVLLVDAALALEGASKRLRVAAALGLRVRLVLAARGTLEGWDGDALSYAKALSSWLTAAELEECIEVHLLDEGELLGPGLARFLDPELAQRASVR